MLKSYLLLCKIFPVLVINWKFKTATNKCITIIGTRVDVESHFGAEKVRNTSSKNKKIAWTA